MFWYLEIFVIFTIFLQENGYTGSILQLLNICSGNHVWDIHQNKTNIIYYKDWSLLILLSEENLEDKSLVYLIL